MFKQKLFQLWNTIGYGLTGLIYIIWGLQTVPFRKKLVIVASTSYVKLFISSCQQNKSKSGVGVYQFFKSGVKALEPGVE